MTTPTLRLGKLLLNFEDVIEYRFVDYHNRVVIRLTDNTTDIIISDKELIAHFISWYESLVPWRPGMQARIVPNAVFEVVDYNPGSKQLRVKWGSGTVHWLPAELFEDVEKQDERDVNDMYVEGDPIWVEAIIDKIFRNTGVRVEIRTADNRTAHITIPFQSIKEEE